MALQKVKTLIFVLFYGCSQHQTSSCANNLNVVNKTRQESKQEIINHFVLTIKGQKLLMNTSSGVFS
jgi:hypothetical protein